MTPKQKLISAAQDLLDAGYSKASIHRIISADVVDKQQIREQLEIDMRHISIYVDIINGLTGKQIIQKYSLKSYGRKSSILLARRKIRATLDLEVLPGEMTFIGPLQDKFWLPHAISALQNLRDNLS